MRQLLAICRRELGAFFRSAMAPVVLTGFLAMTGLMFTLFAFSYSEMSRTALGGGRGGEYLNVTEGIFQPLVMNLTFLLVLIVPAITMRLLSSEFRSRRYDLIASYPVPDHGWVLGKWLSAVAATAVMILAAGVYFIIVAALGKPELGPVLTALLGLLLLTATLAAWGVFFSSLFQYQLVAYLLTFAFAMFLTIVGALEPLVPGPIGSFAAALSLKNHLERFTRGVIDSRDVIYLASLIVLGLYLATASLATRRLAAGRRVWRSLPALALVVVLVVVQILAREVPLRADLTPDQRYSLAPQTVQILDALGSAVSTASVAADRAHDEVMVYAFYQSIDPARKAIEIMLRSCADRSDRFGYQILDPERELEWVRQFGVTLARTVVVSAGDDHTVLLQPDESALINAVYRLTTGSRPVVYHLSGHGEHLLDSKERPGYYSYAELLQAQGYDLRRLTLADRGEVPTDADLIVMAGPRLAPGPHEFEAIDAFLQRGGSLLALLDPGTPPAVVDWVRRFNVRLGEDVIISADQLNREFGVSIRSLIVADGYGSHEITRGLTGVATVFPLVQSMSRVEEEVPGVSGSIFLFSSPLSWSEQDPMTRFSGLPKFDKSVDFQGPLPFGVALRVTSAGVDRPQAAVPRQPAAAVTDPDAGPPEDFGDPLPTSVFDGGSAARLVIVGNSEFATNANLMRYGNRDLLLNMVGWLARESTLINLRGRDLRSQPMVLTASQQKMLGWSSVLVWPLLVGGASVGFILVRRRRDR